MNDGDGGDDDDDDDDNNDYDDDWQEESSENSSLPHTKLTDQQWFELDESTARQQLKSPQSLSGRSIPIPLVTFEAWGRVLYSDLDLSRT